MGNTQSREAAEAAGGQGSEEARDLSKTVVSADAPEAAGGQGSEAAGHLATAAAGPPPGALRWLLERLLWLAAMVFNYLSRLLWNSRNGFEGRTLQAYPPTHPSSAAKKPLKRQVFISHTGQDEGAKTFAASILKPALEAAGLAVYMDFSNLQLGSSWREELVDAAANSMVVVAVLSKTFSNQFWCMLELDLALHAHPQQGGHCQGGGRPLVIPVFYDSADVVVDVDKIRQRWSGELEQQLWEEEELQSEWMTRVDVGRWVDNIVTMKGKVQHMRRRLPGQGSDKDEDWQLARGVVRAAACRIPSLVDVGDVVGLEKQEAALAAELGGRLGLWLYGQGGRGKSTMAKLLFNRLEQAGGFSHSAFVEIQVGDGADKTAHHLAGALEGLGAAVKASDGAALLSRKLKEFVKCKKALFVLDNVWTASQLTALLPTQWGAGSVIIVTSRFESFPDSIVWPKVRKQLLPHEVEVLDAAAARQLFRQAAGLEGAPDSALQKVETAILEACGGLPLALQLMGGQLYDDTDQASWQGALAAMKQGSPGGGSEGALEGVLTHSLAGLSERHVSMFLDVATILRGEPLELVMAVWTAWHGKPAVSCYKDLVRRSLLGADAKGTLAMHDVLVALGRGVILQRKPGLEVHYGSRLWVQDGEVMGSEQAKGRQVVAAQVTVWSEKLAGKEYSTANDEDMQRRQLLVSSLDLSAARILMLGEVQLPPQEGVLWLEQCDAAAEWAQLSWGLVVLMSRNLQGFEWSGVELQAWQQLSALKALYIASYGVCTLPPSFGHQLAGHLQALHFNWCHHLTGLPESLCQLMALQTLDLSGCSQLTALPESFGQLAALQTLSLWECTQLTTLPESFGQLAPLQSLNLRGCSQLTTLPESFGQLAALHTLELWGCTQLTALPESFGQLAALQTLNLGGCTQLTAIPESFGQLAALHTLELWGCSQLTALPESFGQLAALQTLELCGCSRLTALPESFGQLAALQSLNLGGCTQLTAIPESFGQLAALKTLRVCGQLQAIPEYVCRLTALHTLDLSQCSLLTELPGCLGQLTALQTLRVGGQLQAIPEYVCCLTALHMLDRWSSIQLTKMPECLGQLTALQTLRVGGQLQPIPEYVCRLTALQMLDLSQCSLITELPGCLGQLTALQTLRVGGQLQAIPQYVCCLTVLHTLDLGQCSQLTELPGCLGQLTALHELNLRGCKSLRELPSVLHSLEALLKLDIHGCTSLVALPSPWTRSHLKYTLDNLHLNLHLRQGTISEYFGEGCNAVEQGKRQHTGAVVPEGCWISQWGIGWGEDGLPYFIQGLLDDGTTLPPLNWEDRCCEDTVVGEAGGSCTEVHGRAGPDGVHAFMGCGDLKVGEAWTFTCLPGHHIVGYGGSTRVEGEWDRTGRYIGRIRFLTADVAGGPSS